MGADAVTAAVREWLVLCVVVHRNSLIIVLLLCCFIEK